MKPLPWSHSSLTAFQTCPKQFYHLKVLKDVTEEKHPATQWGIIFHKAAEDYLRGYPDKAKYEYRLSKETVDPDIDYFVPYLEQFRMGYGTLAVEQELCLNRKLEPCDWNAPDVWVRGIVDVLKTHDGVAHVGDHKTGKRKAGVKQLKLFALLVFAHYPDIHTCHTAFYWLNTGQTNPETNQIDPDTVVVDRETFTREQIMPMWDAFLPDLKQFAEAFKTETFVARPSGLCKEWCPVTSCEFCGG